MLSMQQPPSSPAHAMNAQTLAEPMYHSSPPIGPEPVNLARKQVDTLYDMLQVVPSVLTEIQIDFILIKSTLLGAVRSKSILFNENRGISLGILKDEGDDKCDAGLKKVLPQALVEHCTKVAANPQQSHCESSPRIHYQERKGDACCDRIELSLDHDSRISIDLYVLCKYETQQDLMKILSDYDLRKRIGTLIPQSAYPLYHYDNEKAISHQPRHYLSVTEVRPLQTISFGALELPCPSGYVSVLDRFYGQDWSTHYHTTGGKLRLLEDHHYRPVQHSDRRIYSDHSRQALEQTIELHRESLTLQEKPSPPSSGGGGGLSRSRSLFTFRKNTLSTRSTDISPSSVTQLSSLGNTSHHPPLKKCESEGGGSPRRAATSKYFSHDVRRHIGDSPSVPEFDKDLRAVIEPHLQKARKQREECRKVTDLMVDASIAGSVGVPYTALRDERRFVFDQHSHPLHQVLAQMLGVDDLSQLHKHPIQDKRTLLAPLLNPETRCKFQECFDTFVTSYCIPLLHSLVMTKKQFQSASGITYRYQAFPCIRVIRPGEFSIGPHCDTAYGHSIGNLNFHIPLTQVTGTNALFIESFPGKEDWHPLTAKSPGLGFLFDGARCLHFTLDNTTDFTRVSLDFRVALYSEDLCSKEFLADRFSNAGPGYYDEAYVALDGSPGALVKRKNHSFMTPDYRVGLPFK